MQAPVRLLMGYVTDYKDSVTVFVNGVKLASRERWKVRRNTVALELPKVKDCIACLHTCSCFGADA